MKIAVMGAGAVGCYYGAMLARAGHDVTLIGRQHHVDAMTQCGLVLDLGKTQETVTVRASTEASAISGAELVLVCVKSTDTDEVAQQIKPFLTADSIVLSLQNGIDNGDRLRAGTGRDVLSAVVYVAAAMAGPGHVCHFGRGDLVLAPSAHSQRVAEVLRPAGIPVEISANAVAALWSKVILNCAYNAVSAISQMSYADMVAVDGVWDVMHSAVSESQAVAAACGVKLPETLWDSIRSIAETMPHQKSSTAQDIANGKPTEIDYLNGYIVRKGQELGIATPTNQTLLALTRLCEASARGGR